MFRSIALNRGTLRALSVLSVLLLIDIKYGESFSSVSSGHRKSGTGAKIRKNLIDSEVLFANCFSDGIWSAYSGSIILSMGLYDDPLPSLPRRTNDDDKPSEQTSFSFEQRLFQMTDSGKEKNNLLPPLPRSLKSRPRSYFKPTDRKVQNLVDKTSVDPVDACWALEACKGNISETLNRIETARRFVRDNPSAAINMDDDGWSVKRQEQEFAKRESDRRKKEQQQKMQDEKWLPGKENPKPIDDEPWFTG